eukprot:6084539-Alexandrium_andersonii.AAC.1
MARLVFRMPRDSYHGVKEDVWVWRQRFARALEQVHADNCIQPWYVSSLKQYWQYAGHVRRRRSEVSDLIQYRSVDWKRTV